MFSVKRVEFDLHIHSPCAVIAQVNPISLICSKWFLSQELEVLVIAEVLPFMTLESENVVVEHRVLLAQHSGKERFEH